VQDKLVYQSCSTAKINYSNESIEESEIQIIPHGLVFQNEVEEQHISCFHWGDVPAFFQTSSNEIPFDIFSAAFYLIARYEEWLPFEADQYGRYGHTNSIAYKNNFLHLPLVQIWLIKLERILQKKIPIISCLQSNFPLCPVMM